MSSKKIAVVFLVLALVLSGCSPKTEEVKGEIKEVAEEAKEGALDAAQEVKDLAEKATEEVKEVVEDVKKEVEDVKDEAKEEVSALGGGSVKNYEEIKITPEEAYEIFSQKYPEIKIHKIELDRDDGNYVYEVKGFDKDNWWDLDIHPITGEILKEHLGTKKGSFQPTEITLEQVKKIQDLVDKTLEEEGENAQLLEWTLEYDNGRAELEVEVEVPAKGDMEYTYDVDSGELIKIDD